MYRDLEPQGDPLYVPLLPSEHTYPYGTDRSYGGVATIPAPRERSEPWTGWLVAAVGALSLATTVFAWVTLYYRADSGFGPVTAVEVVHGYDGLLGPPTVILYAVCIVGGVLVGVRRGGGWLPITGLVAGVVVLVFVVFKSVAIELSADLTSADSVIGPGFWAALLSTGGLVASSIVAVVRRQPAQERR